MNPLNLDGLVVAAVTPMSQSGDINHALIPDLVAHYLRHQMTGVYLLGSTGEGMSLTDQERLEAAEIYLNTIGGRMKTILQVGHSSLRTSALLAARGAELGVDAISATPPGYFKPNDESGLVECLRILTEGAPDTPFYYYHIPYLSGVSIDPVKLTRLALERLPTFVGIKYSDPATLYNLPLLQAVDPHLEFMSGVDEAYLQCLAQGYRAAIGSTYGFAAPIFHRVRQAFQSGNLDQARLWQDRALQMIHHLFATCGRAGLKEMMKLAGIDCGPVRHPIDPVTPQQSENLRSAMKSIGWFDWIEDQTAVPA